MVTRHVFHDAFDVPDILGAHVIAAGEIVKLVHDFMDQQLPAGVARGLLPQVDGAVARVVVAARADGDRDVVGLHLVKPALLRLHEVDGEFLALLEFGGRAEELFELRPAQLHDARVFLGDILRRVGVQRVVLAGEGRQARGLGLYGGPHRAAACQQDQRCQAQCAHAVLSAVIAA